MAQNSLPPALQALIAAAQHADWTQVVLNGGPPCFRFEADRGRFCLRAERWHGHGDGEWPMHQFVPLPSLLEAFAATLLDAPPTWMPIPTKPPMIDCEACAAGFRLADDGIHYDDARDGATWGVCRRVVDLLRQPEDVFHAIARRLRADHERFQNRPADGGPR